MKASRFSDAQEAFILKQGSDGMPVAEICRKVGAPPRRMLGKQGSGSLFARKRAPASSLSAGKAFRMGSFPADDDCARSGRATAVFCPFRGPTCGNRPTRCSALLAGQKAKYRSCRSRSSAIIGPLTMFDLFASTSSAHD